MLPPDSRGRAYPLTAAPDAILAVAYLFAWLVPAGFAVASIGNLILLIEVEALVVAAAFVVGVCFVAEEQYFWGSVFLVGLAVIAFKELFRYGFWWPILAFGFLVFNRFHALAVGRLETPEARAAVGAGAGGSLFVYIGAFLLSRLLPELGKGLDVAAITEHARWCRAPSELIWVLFVGEGGKDAPPPWLWCEAPYKALACGFVYFAANVYLTIRQPAARVDNPDKLT